MKKIVNKILVSFICIALMISTLSIDSYAITPKEASNTSTYNISTNTRYTNQRRTGSEHRLKYVFTIPQNGVLEPIIYVDAEKASNFVFWETGLFDMNLDRMYATLSTSWDYEDGDGHQWEVYSFGNCRLPAGTYCFYFDHPGSMINEYGSFDIIIKFKDESGRNNVETEFNDTRNTADPISFNKYYYGNNHCNDVDYYKLELTSKTNVDLKFYNRSGSFNMNFSPCIVDNDGNVVCTETYIGTSEDANGNVFDKYQYVKTLNAGTYYFKVWNFYEYDVDYKIYVNTKPGKVTNLKLKSGSKKVTVSFNKPIRSQKYEIYRKAKGGSWKKVKTTTSSTWTNKSLKKGKTYYYKVRAVNGNTKGAFSVVKKVKVK